MIKVRFFYPREWLNLLLYILFTFDEMVPIAVFGIRISMNLHHSGKLDPDPHRSQKPDLHPHESEKLGAVEALKEPLRGSPWSRGGSP
jgi:hypothetical protein